MADVTTKLAAEIVDEIFSDLSDRSGFYLHSLDEETQNEIRETWTQIILRIAATGA